MCRTHSDVFCFDAPRAHPDIPSFPTRRSSDLAEMRHVRAAGGRILVVAGPAVVHTGAGVYLSRLIELGYVQVLFAGKDRKSTRLNSSHTVISYAVFCLKKKKK